jgi:uncharacterized protein YoxC
MTFTITLQEIILILLFMLGTAIGIYLIVVLKNANQLIINTNKTLSDNRQNIDRLLMHLEEFSNNTTLLTQELKKQFEKNEKAVKSIITGADSMLAISDTTDHLRILAASFTEIIEAVKRFFKK